ncbi:MAG TPA: LUD domain-containing protein [Phycisphaerae bacterium]|nr:LUD domain-containing protein [Phycisphaerae bacterium]
MLQARIDNIGRIVRSLDGVEYPEPLVAPAVNEDLAAVFERQLNALRAPGDEEPAVIHVADAEEAARVVAELCRGVPESEIIRQGSGGPAPRRDCAVGITPASVLIASTGSVILELPRAEEGQASLLVDRHIVVAHRGQLVPDVPAFYGLMSERCQRGERLTNQVCITGCSRTADIEKLLVVPAHGPRQVRVVLSRVPVEWGAISCSSSLQRLT